MERFVKPLFRWTFEREVSRVLSRVAFGLAVDAGGGRWSLGAVVGVAVVGDVPERSGSECRHDAVRESGSQFFHAQVVASESRASVTAFRRAVGDSAGEGRFCCGGAPARREGFGHSRADLAVTENEIIVQSLEVISAQAKPASSLAIAVATTDLTFLRAASTAKRLDNLVWAFQDRAMVAGVAPAWRWLRVGPDRGVVLVGPGRFAQLGSDVTVAGSGDGSSPLGQAGRVLRAGQAGKPMKVRGGREAPPVEDLGAQAQRAHVGDAP